jgi:predicted nucleic acid-binding protein
LITSLDSNVLIALWDPGDALNSAARQALDAADDRGRLTINGIVFAELLASPGRTEAFVDEFLISTGIAVEWTLSEAIWRTAGKAFQSYVKRRRRQKSGNPRRLMADFLIGAHAAEKEYRLLTLDAGIYRAAFPKLDLVAIR